MTIDEKTYVINEFCLGKACLECAIKDICQSITGAFKNNPDHCDAAYEIVMGIKKDNVNHPAHYETGKFECIDVMVETQGEDAVKAFCLCNAFKYLYRHKNKNGVEDIKKARWYLDMFLKLEGETDD